MKQIIRLTESDLHRMIKESVREVLSEGQGLDFAKETWRDTKNDYDWDEFKSVIQHDDFPKKAKNFIKKGDADGEDGEYYDKDSTSFSSSCCDKDNRKRINKSLRGKIGRAAGLGAGFAAAGFNAAKNSMRKRFNDK